MFNKKLVFLLILSFFFTISSCENKDEDCFYNAYAYVRNVTAPTSGVVNQDIVINFKFLTNTTCGKLDKLEEKINGDAINVEVMAKYEGCSCQSGIFSIDAQYKFKPTKAGTYIFYFKSADDSIDPYPVVVE